MRYAKIVNGQIVISDINDGSYQDTFANNQKLLLDSKRNYLKPCNHFLSGDLIYSATAEIPQW